MRVFEDFVPISPHVALITTGPQLDALDSIDLVRWSVDDGGAVGIHECHPLFREPMDAPIRLGGWFDGHLVYSAARGVVGAYVESPMAHQPFVHEGACYYTDDLPHVRIYRDGEVYLDHFADMIQVGNPCWGGGAMYFEARSTDAPDRPDAWQIWRQAPGEEPEFVCPGANPAWWRGRLFVGTWNGSGFTYHRRAA